MARAIYYVSYDIEYGYTFDLAESDSRIFPSIAETELPKFDQFLAVRIWQGLPVKEYFAIVKPLHIVTDRRG